MGADLIEHKTGEFSRAVFVKGGLGDIKGTLFDTTTDSLHAIAANIDEFLGIARTASSATVTDSESDVYIDDSVSSIVNGISIKIDTSLMEAADTFDFKVHYRIESGGSYLQVADTITYTGVQSAPLKIFKLEAYRYGMKVTGQRTAGTNRVFKYEVIRET